MTQAQDLLRLQHADTRVDGLNADVAASQALLRSDPALDQARAAAAGAESERREREREAEVAEAEMNALQKRMTTLDRRLYGGSVHNPQDLMEMQRELDVLRQRLSVSEDGAIAALAEAEAAVAAEQEGLSTLQAEESRRLDAIEPLEAQLARQRADLVAATADRDGIVAAIDPSALALYRKVSARRSPAVVGLAGDSCGGCHLPMSQDERRLVKAGSGVAQCSNCDRVLVP
ncbi:MAG: zinc ribbon domain-containing protein [Candidatus Dormibacteria bacterium]